VDGCGHQQPFAKTGMIVKWCSCGDRLSLVGRPWTAGGCDEASEDHGHLHQGLLSHRIQAVFDRIDFAGARIAPVGNNGEAGSVIASLGYRSAPLPPPKSLSLTLQFRLQLRYDATGDHANVQTVLGDRNGCG
jgi:hypothetical protein